MYFYRNILIILFLFSFTAFLNAQHYEKSLKEEPASIQNQNGNGDVTNTTTLQVNQNRDLVKDVTELSKHLNQARETGNTDLIEQLEDQINALLGNKRAVPGVGPQAVPLTETIMNKEGDNPIGISVITSGAIWGTATTTQNTDGRIWVATTNYAFGESDTLRIFYSDNGGTSWTYFNGFTYIQPEVDFLANDIDIEVLNDGTSWYIYITGGYNYNGSKWAFVTRYKADGTGFFYLNLPKNDSTDQYWARVVSDYPRWESSAYVYIVATMDSALNATDKRIWSRAFTIEDPYANPPTVINRNNNQNGSAYWWYAPTAAITARARCDVAYYDSLTQGDRIVTSAIFEYPGISQNIYMTYSNNYMATVPYLYNNFSLTYASNTPMMSFSGGNNQLTGCIATVRFWQDTLDTDARYIVTNDGGATWNQGYIEASSDTTLKADVIALKGIDGHFKFGVINMDSPNPEFLYRTGYMNGSFTLTSSVSMYGAGIYPDDVYGGRAGYKLTGSDSCFAVFEGQDGSSAYGVSGCSGPVSIEEDEVIPINYSLSQNYPNPFNPSTAIKYSIPQSSFVKINVYNTIGQEVAQLVNQELHVGNFEVTFDARNLPSGIYFYRLEAGNFVQTNKMILIK